MRERRQRRVGRVVVTSLGCFVFSACLGGSEGVRKENRKRERERVRVTREGEGETECFTCSMPVSSL
jgi:hypothetical protein